MRYLQALQTILNDPAKAIRLGIFNGDRHVEDNAFEHWESRELGCTQGVLNAYQKMVNSIDNPLSIQVVNDIRTGLFNEKVYGLLKSKDAINKHEENRHMHFLIAQQNATLKDRENLSYEKLRTRIDIADEPPYKIQNLFDNLEEPIIFYGTAHGGIAKEYAIQLIKWYNNQDIHNLTKEQIFTNILELVRDLERIHPYGDFNCRTFNVLILNRELTKHGFLPCIMEDPNVFDYKNLDELKNLVRQGQTNFQNLMDTGRLHSQDPSNERWYSAIPKYFPGIRQQFHTITKGQYRNLDNSLTAEELYLQNYATIDSLQDVPPDKCDVLLSFGMQELYKRGFKLDEFKNFSIPKIMALSTNKALLLQQKYPQIYKKLMQHGEDQISILVSLEAQKIYAKYPFAFELIASYTKDKIQALTTPNALQLYEMYPSAFYKFQEYDADKIQALTTTNVLELCKEYSIKIFDELEKFDISKIKALTSLHAAFFYKRFPTLFDEAQDWSTEKIVDFLSLEAYRVYTSATNDNLKQYNITSFEDCINNLKLHDEKTNKVLSRKEVQEALELKYFTENDIRIYNSKKIKALTSPSVIRLLEKQFVEFKDLKDLSAQQIRAISSSEACELYEDKYATINDFKLWSHKKINSVAQTLEMIKEITSEYIFTTPKILGKMYDNNTLYPIIYSLDLTETVLKINNILKEGIFLEEDFAKCTHKQVKSLLSNPSKENQLQLKAQLVTQLILKEEVVKPKTIAASIQNLSKARNMQKALPLKF